jgi:ABC-type sugar transport system ATPase subunit
MTTTPESAVEVPPVIEGREITKRYGALTALQGVDLKINAGEIVGLVGDNGAGKSTLIKILSGALQPTSGELLVDGEPIGMHSPLQARRTGIETVYQDLALAPDLTVSENLFIGRELKRSGVLRMIGVLDRRKMNTRAKDELDRLKIRVDSVTDRADALSGGQRQAIAVARAVAWGRRVILMDEPTAALGVEEQEKVAHLIETVRSGGTPVLLVSHNIPQVHEICDRIVVLFRGRVVANLDTKSVSIEDVVMWITGAAIRLQEIREQGERRGS